ncbi:NUDIX domain-containing protein [Subtercola vilae]|uniref:NUDIX domain-containing protein n=1 Tax=Subtercola vilae TaxID=2056433 RepID=A0A4V4RFB1_9MICO|nr:NUDIX domain-containing protein [Subtercola vilae]TIH37114.1 NUDIX domain-containing protein [Subtercola vilae]
MAGTTSAGILLYRGDANSTEVFIAHMGGPFWAKKDAAAWSAPKGEYTIEDPLAAARREFREEIGVDAPALPYVLLGDFRQRSGKVVRLFTARCEQPIAFARSNTFELEWPRGSGRLQQFPEIDDARWVARADALRKLVTGQVPALDALTALLEQSEQGGQGPGRVSAVM